MSTRSSRKAYVGAKASGTLATKNQQALNAFKRVGPMTILDLKDELNPNGLRAKSRSNCDAIVSYLYFRGELDIVGETIINGNTQSVYDIPKVPHKRSEVVKRVLMHKNRMLQNTQKIIAELNVELNSLVSQGK